MKLWLRHRLTNALTYAPLLAVALFYQDAVTLLIYVILVGAGDQLVRGRPPATNAQK